MSQVPMALMRHESIETSMRNYVGRNANVTAAAAWSSSEKSQEGTVLRTVGQHDTFGAGVESDSNVLSNNGLRK